MTFSEDPCSPIAVLVWRGDVVESRHRVAHASADASGRLVAHGGDPQLPVFPRSAVKPLQALALVESGAADRYGLGAEELALASASHGGEPAHVDLVTAWLARLGLGPQALECGVHPPAYGPAAAKLAAAGLAPTTVHNNCSGKHAGMLTLARHLGAPLAGYIRPEHPVQRRIARILAEVAGTSELAQPAIDGCGVPTWPMSLAALATAMARMADPAGLPTARADACSRIRAAMTTHPHLVAGTGRACTEIMTAAPELLVKIGAEGVYAAALPQLRLGLALKVEDGASRAAPVALLALLGRLGAFDPDTLPDQARPRLRNHAGTVVGRITPAEGNAA